MVFFGRFSVVSDDKVSAVKVGFLGFQTASVDLDKAVVNRELAGFNVADICICCGAGIVVLAEFFGKKN